MNLLAGRIFAGLRRGGGRRWLRALHRDVGYLLVGLTFVYAVSGLAVNHIGDFDPNFIHGERTIVDRAHLPPSAVSTAERSNVVRAVTERLSLETPPSSTDWLSPTEAELLWDTETVYVDLARGTIDHTWQRPRPLLRAVNYLHLNRGKKAWTVVADAYAVLLLFLATTGLFMIRTRGKGFARKALLVLAGAAIPIAYVTSAKPPTPTGATTAPASATP